MQELPFQCVLGIAPKQLQVQSTESQLPPAFVQLLSATPGHSHPPLPSGTLGDGHDGSHASQAAFGCSPGGHCNEHPPPPVSQIHSPVDRRTQTPFETLGGPPGTEGGEVTVHGAPTGHRGGVDELLELLEEELLGGVGVRVGVGVGVTGQAGPV